jgi:hypothetical protein
VQAFVFQGILTVTVPIMEDKECGGDPFNLAANLLLNFIPMKPTHSSEH